MCTFKMYKIYADMFTVRNGACDSYTLSLGGVYVRICKLATLIQIKQLFSMYIFDALN